MWWPLLLLALSIAILVGAGAAGGPLQLANPDLTGVSEMRAAFEALPEEALVLVAMDGDLGTYPEIRPAVRTALEDLLAGGASLAFVSVSVEGRAIAVAEQARLMAAGESEDSLLDLGFISGVEAGMVLLVGMPFRPARAALWPTPWQGGAVAWPPSTWPFWWAGATSARVPGLSRSARACRTCRWWVSLRPSRSRSWRRTCAPASWWPCWPPSVTTPRTSRRSPRR